MYGRCAMATTNKPDSKVEALRPYPESDKIGPIGGKRSVFDDEAELRRTMVTEFQATAESARAAAANVDRDPVAAVHEYRKALRRARAVLALITDALPRNERRALQRALREARRALGAARDQAVAPEAISTVELAETDRDTAKTVIAAAEGVLPADEIKQLLAEGAARAAAQVEALEAALPPTLTFETLARGVRRVYAQARKARTRAKRSTKAFHEWRRRTKELTYQLELLAGYAGERTLAMQRSIEAVGDMQGPAVDLLMLRGLIDTHGNGIATEPIDHLAAAIEDRLGDLMSAARRAGRDVFRRKPRRFAKRLEKAVRRDLAPVAAADDLTSD